MKILFVIDCLVSGGKERRLVELMKGLKAEPTVEFELITMNRDVHYKEVFDLGINVHYVIRKTKKDLSVISSFYRICKQFKPDVIHCWDGMTAFFMIPASKRLHIKLINGMVSDSLVNKKHWWRTRLTFAFSNVIVGNSKTGLAAYKAPRKKSICIYNGFNFKRLSAVGNPEGFKRKFDLRAPCIVLMVGAFEDRKDYDTYFAAAKQLNKERSDVEFVAVGGGQNLPRYQEELANEPGVKLLGVQSDVESIVNFSDICVLTTNSNVHAEGISNSILEYMASAKPVIATTGGGTNEIVVDGKTGFLVNPSDVNGLVDKVRTLLNNASLRQSFGAAGRKRIEDHFSIAKMVDKYIALYKNCMLKKKSERREAILISDLQGG